MKKIVLLAFVLVLLSLAVVVGFIRPVTASLPLVHNNDTVLHHATTQEPPTTTDDYDGLWHTTDFTKTLSADGQPYLTTENANNALEYWSGDINDPSGSILINNNDTYTNSTSVTLTLTYGDATPGVSQVRYSNDGVWDTEPWESPSTTKAWILTTGDGTKTVYYQVRDNASLVSDTYFDTIILDTTPPTISITSPSDGAEVRSSPMILWNGADATSGVDHYEIRLDDGSWKWKCAGCTFYTFIDVGDGSHTVEIKAFDKAGNSRVFSVKFTLNTSPVGGPGYAEEQAIILVVVLVVLATATYFLKIRKKTSARR